MGSRSAKSDDPEFNAIRAIIRYLSPLTPGARVRVLDYISDRFDPPVRVTVADDDPDPEPPPH